MIAGRCFIALSWVFLVATSLLVAAEYGLASWERAKEEDRKHNSRKPQFMARKAAYRPFTVKHVHPVYLFFFPFEGPDRARLSNGVVTLDERGFRGTGVESQGDREIAVLLGGSTAFGHFASSDATTIAGYLNGMQSRYGFLNAGVPSWNTTQELARLNHQIIGLRPKLVVALDGANDVTIVRKYWEKGVDFPPGTPESFDKLSDLVDGQSGGEPRYGTLPSLRERLFPELTRVLEKHLESRRNGREPAETPPDEQIEEAAARYVMNLRLMHQISAANESRFVGILQPIRELHRNVDERHKKSKRIAYFAKFREYVLREHARSPDELEFHDFSRVFDEEFGEVPVYDTYGWDDLDDGAVFVSTVHMLDRGNEIAARRIWSLIQGSERADRARGVAAARRPSRSG